MVENPYNIGDPVMDGAQGRPMVVLDAPDTTVAQWSDRNGYDLLDNYANSKFDPDAEEPVVECVYVSDVRSEPSKTYTFPVSRVRLIDAHHADDGRRLYDRVVRDVLERLWWSATGAMEPDNTAMLESVMRDAGFGQDVIDEARELADVERTVVVDDE